MQAATTTSRRIQEQLTARLPLVWVSLAFLAGIVLASLVSLPIFVWVGLSIVSIFLVILARILSTRLDPSTFHFPLLTDLLRPFAFILLTALFLGAARYQLSVPRFDAFHIAFYNDRDYDLFITGTVI